VSVSLTRGILWSLGLVLVASGVSPVAQGTGQAPAQAPAPAPAPPTPVQLANQAERQRIMNQLKISAIPPGAVSSSPDTYNEATANPYPNLPDPLTLKSGQKVTTASVWRGKRRAELLEDFQREIYGRTPKTPKVTWAVVSTTTGTNGDTPIVTKQLLGTVDNSAYPAIKVEIQATLNTPANASAPVPVIVIFGGGGFPPAPGVDAPANPCAPPGGFGPPGGRGAAPAGGRGPGAPPAPTGPTWQQQLLAKGWGYANLNTLTFDRKGRVWFTGQSGYYGRLDPARYDVKVWKAPRGRGPYGITTTPGGEVYYASLAGNHIARVDTETGEATVIEPPTKEQGARRVWSDSRGRIWVSYWNTGHVGLYDPSTKSWREWKLPGNAHTYSVWVDDKDKVWLTDWSTNAIVKFDPDTEKFVSFPSTGANANVRQMLGRSAEAWGAESGVDRLVMVPAR